MMNNITISVMIPTKNRCKSLKMTLDSLAKQTYKDFEVIIIDGGSTDGTEALVDGYRRFFPIQWGKEKHGLIPQMNTAFKMARGLYVTRIDDDVVMSESWLQSIVETFESDSSIGAVTGPTLIPTKYLNNRDLFFYERKLREGNLFWRLIGKIYFDYFLEGMSYKVCHWCKCGAFTLGTNFVNSLNEPLQEVTNIEACNWSTRKELLERIGGYDLKFLGIGEYHEPDASFKIMNLGYKLIFNPKAIVNHCPSQDGFYKTRPNSYTRMTNFILFYFRHIRPNTIEKIIRFCLYLCFLNCFYIFIGFKRREFSQFQALPGTFIGIIKAFRDRLDSVKGTTTVGLKSGLGDEK